MGDSGIFAPGLGLEMSLARAVLLFFVEMSLKTYYAIVWSVVGKLFARKTIHGKLSYWNARKNPPAQELARARSQYDL